MWCGVALFMMLWLSPAIAAASPPATSDCVGLVCVLKATNSTWAGGGLSASLALFDTARRSGLGWGSRASLHLTAAAELPHVAAGAHAFEGDATWDEYGQELSIDGGTWHAYASALSPATLLLHLRLPPAASAGFHALSWQRPLPRGELARFAEAAAMLAAGEAAAAGSLGPPGRAVLLQDLSGGLCLLSSPSSADDEGGDTAAGRASAPTLGDCASPEAVWQVGAGAAEATRELRAAAASAAGGGGGGGGSDVCLRRPAGSSGAKPLALGKCGSLGTRRWELSEGGRLSARAVSSSRLRFCVRVARPSDEEGARAWAACVARPACADAGEVGLCCPDQEGVRRECCDDAAAPPLPAALETASCDDEAAAAVLRVLSAPGLAPRAALHQSTSQASGASSASSAASAAGGAGALTKAQLDWLNGALLPESRMQLAAAAAASSGGRGGGGGGGGGGGPAPGSAFLRGVRGSHLEAWHAAAAAVQSGSRTVGSLTEQLDALTDESAGGEGGGGLGEGGEGGGGEGGGGEGGGGEGGGGDGGGGEGGGGDGGGGEGGGGLGEGGEGGGGEGGGGDGGGGEGGGGDGGGGEGGGGLGEGGEGGGGEGGGGEGGGGDGGGGEGGGGDGGGGEGGGGLGEGGEGGGGEGGGGEGGGGLG
ncbi:hypothetical protein EMIHUDRAFT_116011, partial [Emiliania huxleyi CCMP1516]|uniref:Uncharacterized protein n=2 Tax=Emiliania huxleyi TaxID=2903 RepID=A0A0D3JLB4_EMIH1